MPRSQQPPAVGTAPRARALQTPRRHPELVESWAQAWEAKCKKQSGNDLHQPYEAFASGEPCRACARALLDNPAPSDGTDADAAVNSDNAVFRSVHETCNMGYWSIENRRVDHCHLCCPAPPLSPLRREKLRSLLSQRTLHDYTWHAKLTCGHIEVVVSGNPDHTQWAAWCPECAAIRGVVTAMRIDDQTGGNPSATDVDDAVPLYQPLTGEQWDRIKHILQADDVPRRGRPRSDARAVMDASLYRAHTGIAWRDLPPQFGSWQTAARRYRQLATDGGWEAALRALSHGERTGSIDNDLPHQPAQKAHLDNLRQTDF